ncbi:similar to Saccharomyces cerevisiae YPL052W OAZ1 Regulator of ornithine decarboxylase (Spe1p), antizyme that binds to Spe1p to regulate ubiquitin-independent degradation [Maudiozyma saulgeensis]|uniref:Similar to Saccharomyces cerevisiae YPL052W OAZ1 Regulator of ornithine decarboxylase (Spe1p), antizyme that binds to Spe1p to regulate ubiquitin-independent degradation n=1 Tax=Maudiozyma saulgeensis TaxID=1789683 RepID=A0A1X7R710_9SACH|nr:similar to Saccharomyces cerevisiae YPL052W OAZ1 Regulator of ornithine decarboxylase (Spe1p), antizyme that binds to Spe1p to regulate ubiquitin-independent degradation [Kazachstania saulgeensis]
MDLKSGVRDTTRRTRNISSSIENDDENSNYLIELYWDIILLLESQFMVSNIDIRKFRQSLINKFSNKINNKKDVLHNYSSLWRSIGDEYFLLYLPVHYNDILYAKRSGSSLHVPLSNPLKLFSSTTQASFKDLLLILLEFAFTHNCHSLRIYFPKDSSQNNNIESINSFKKILMNLNWIGGKIVKNEDRDSCLEQMNFDDLMTSDEKFLVLEFEC